VRGGPALGRVGGAGGERRERRVADAAAGEPLPDARLRGGAERELRRAAVGLDVEVARRREVALGDRYVPAVDIELRGDQQRAGDGAEADEQDRHHAANVRVRCPASPAGLVFAAMPPPPHSPPAPPRPPVRPHPKTILWVDDEVEGLAAHRQFLEQQGFTVEQAAHGDDALALLRRQPYSLVLLDEQMPGKRGLELLPEIRAIDPAMPVVMVTQSEEEALLREAIGIEVDDYLVKPVHPRQILSVITRLLEGDRIRQPRLPRDS